eukprot:gene2254-2578_t
MLCSIARKVPDLCVIIDCKEMRIPTPQNPIAKQLTFSSYKSNNTAKVLIGISPSGAISFVSEVYGGSISGKEITKRSCILDKFQESDILMADRGFTIHDETKIRGNTCIYQ